MRPLSAVPHAGLAAVAATLTGGIISRNTAPSYHNGYSRLATISDAVGFVVPSNCFTATAPRASTFRVVAPPTPLRSGRQCSTMFGEYVRSVGDNAQV